MWKRNEIYITENGCGVADDPGADGIVYDSDRIMFLRSFTQLQRATLEGIPAEPNGQVRVVGRLPVTGFGLIYVDYATQKRTPMGSASFYREVIARNAVA